ncbi:hypothetical protein [Brevundimonas subvibrioides]|uniref:Uncharacterized protein n=1 Tax=Brevundimonas subvibrioides (strain ATCC 15264 / DSM 4735 / LMG 14903 / NBRC 16000 / CB 81) TaxID=633149 RepID=D9QIA3_BRESC|nr:hypothetical protein [Brevundimonas subvibrioides]ADK99405.1 hypothetical protein Bresu_0091 [Brevundimonas subvibrioides ATCC 15264]
MSAGFKRRRKAQPGNITTADDVALFQTLAKRARTLAAQPSGDAIGLVQCAEKAAHAVPPQGHRQADSAFFSLVRLGKRFLLLTPAEREGAVADLIAWATTIERALADVQTAPVRSTPRPAPTYRAPYAENDL